MMITVSICTWNRALALDRTLTSFRSLHIPSALRWELQVIDNNSTDNTREICAKHAPELPLKLLTEEKQGLSNARNCGIEAAQGDLLIWTDDDVLVPETWLQAYAEGVQKYPDADFFGGPIEPSFDEEPPAWLLALMPFVGNTYGKIDLGPEEVVIGEDVHPCGANFAVRSDVQRRYLFDGGLGRKGNELLMGEESVLLRQIQRDGHIGRWLPAAGLLHCIPPSLVTMDYLCRRFDASGRTTFLLRSGPPKKRGCLQKKIAYYRALCTVLRCIGCSNTWAKYVLRTSYHRGYLAALSDGTE